MTQVPTIAAQATRPGTRRRKGAAVVATFAGGFAVVGSVVTLLGWALDVRRLTDWRNDGISMFANTAVCALLLGVAAIILAQRRSVRWIAAARVLAGVAASIGAVTLLEHITGANLGVDTLLANRPWGQAAAAAPMRMGLPASTSFLALGVVLLFATFGERARRAASHLAILPLLVSSLSLTGYWFGADSLFGVARWTGIALQTSAMVAALGIAALAIVPEYGLGEIFGRQDAGGAVFRQLLLPIIVVPLILGWIRIVGQNAGLYDLEFGTALRSLFEILFLLLLLWWTSLSISRQAGAATEAQGRLGAIVESSDDAIVSKSLDGIIRTWNAGAERIFGYSAAEAVGQHITLIIPPERRAEETEILSRIKRGERIEHFDTIRVRKDGTLRHVSLTVSPLRNGAGNLIGASKIARDVTAARRAEELVRRSEEELKTLADAIPQMAWMTTPDGDVTWYNRVWYDYTGTTFEEMRGWGWQRVIEPLHLTAVVDSWKRSLATGEPFDMEFPIRGADGRFRWFLNRGKPLLDENRKVVRWFGTNTDIDEAKQAETALRDQARTLELLNRAGEAVGSTLELDQLLQSVTDIATELSGAEFGAFFYNSTGDSGESYLLFTLSGAPREAFEKFGNPRATPLFGPTFQGEGPIRSDDVTKDLRYGQMGPHHGMPKGHLPVRSYLAAPVKSPSGEVIGGLFFGHSDVGVFSEADERIIVGVAAQAAVAVDNARLYKDLKQAAEERSHLLEAERAARAEAERAGVMKDEFLATLSHELRTPLNAILGWSQILGLSSPDDEDFRQGVEAIERNARMQTQLINDLLDMSRIISGKIRLDVQRTDLASVVDLAVDSVRPSADAKQIRLRKILDPHAGPISGDPVRLQQVVWNLLTNAIKFTPKEGKVDVVLERVNSHVEITVHDSGIGINPEFLPMVFERFRQADASTTRSYGGLGLGLSIVKTLVELHGGTIHAMSLGENQGASFIVKLPLTPIRSTEDREHPTTPRSTALDCGEIRLGGVKILVVDDEPDARDLIKRVLHQCDAEVCTAANASDGLRLVRKERPDVIVSDIGMPEKDGYQFMRDVRNLSAEEGGRTPAVALTAFARSEDRTRALMAGYQVHLAKPIEPQELLVTVGSVVGRAGGA